MHTVNDMREIKLEDTMKKRFSLLAAILAAGTLSAPAFAADKHYVRGDIGINWFNDVPNGPSKAVMNNGFTGTAAIGCNYNSYRLEGEAGYLESGIDRVNGVSYNGNVSVYSLMANGYYDFDAGSVKPFIMGGLGVAQVGFNNVQRSGSASTYSEHDTAFAYQVGVGIGVPISPGLNLDARYRYFATTNFTAAAFDYSTSHVSSNGLLIGLRMNF